MSSLNDNIEKLGKAAVSIPAGLLEAGSSTLASWYRSQGMTRQNSGSAMSPYNTGGAGTYVQNDNGRQIFSAGKKTTSGLTFTRIKSPIDVYNKICSIAMLLGIKVTKTVADLADLDEDSALAKFFKSAAKRFGWIGSTLKELVDWLTGAIAWQDISLDDDGKAYPTAHPDDIMHIRDDAYSSGLLIAAPGVRGAYNFKEGANTLSPVVYPTFADIKSLLANSLASSLDKAEAAWERDMASDWDIVYVMATGQSVGDIGGYNVTISGAVTDEAARIITEFTSKTEEAEYLAEANSSGRIYAVKKDSALDSYGLTVKAAILSGLIAGEWEWAEGNNILSLFTYSSRDDEWSEGGYANHDPVGYIEYGGNYLIQYKDASDTLVSSPWVVGTLDKWGGQPDLTTYDSPTTQGSIRRILSLASYVVTTAGARTSDGSQSIYITRIVSAFQAMSAGSYGTVKKDEDGVEDATGDGRSIGQDQSADDYMEGVGAKSIGGTGIDSRTGDYTDAREWANSISGANTRSEALNPADVRTDTAAQGVLSRAESIAQTAAGAAAIDATMPQPQPVPVIAPDEIINKIPKSDANTGLYILYNPSISDLRSFASWLWSDDALTAIKKIIQDPMQAIISLHKVYIEPNSGDTANIILGNIESTVSAPVCTSRYVRQSMGQITIPFYNNNFMDFDGVTLDIWLPFIGFKRLDTSVCMGQTLTLVYTLDLLTGALTATLANRAGIIYVFSGQMADEIPLSASDFTRLYSGLISAATGAALGGISGGISGAATAGASGIAGLPASMSTPVEKTCASGSMGALAPKTPYIVEQITQTYRPYQYRYNIGLPENEVVRLVSSTGFTVADGLRGGAGDMTDDEMEELRGLFAAGVVIPYFDQSSDAWTYADGYHVERVYIVTPTPYGETTRPPEGVAWNPHYS